MPVSGASVSAVPVFSKMGGKANRRSGARGLFNRWTFDEQKSGEALRILDGVGEGLRPGRSRLIPMPRRQRTARDLICRVGSVTA
jgi:hypothetical protein